MSVHAGCCPALVAAVVTDTNTTNVNTGDTVPKRRFISLSCQVAELATP